MNNKYQEALDKLYDGYQDGMAGRHYYDIVQELVNKETPKKVFLNKECKIVQCPTCKVAFTDYIRSPFGSILRHTKRCYTCGQRLDWSDTNE